MDHPTDQLTLWADQARVARANYNTLDWSQVITAATQEGWLEADHEIGGRAGLRDLQVIIAAVERGPDSHPGARRVNRSLSPRLGPICFHTHPRGSRPIPSLADLYNAVRGFYERRTALSVVVSSGPTIVVVAPRYPPDSIIDTDEAAFGLVVAVAQDLPKRPTVRDVMLQLERLLDVHVAPPFGKEALDQLAGGFASARAWAHVQETRDKVRAAAVRK